MYKAIKQQVTHQGVWVSGLLNLDIVWKGAYAPEGMRNRLEMKIGMNKRPLIGIAVIVIKEGRVLLGKRKNSHGSGTWALPGGHLEFNESIEACAQREVSEETGIRIKNLRYGPYTNDIFADEGKHYVTLFVTADYESGTPVVKEPHKCEKWAWFQWPPDVHPCFLPITNLLKLNFKLPK